VTPVPEGGKKKDGKGSTGKRVLPVRKGVSHYQEKDHLSRPFLKENG